MTYATTAGTGSSSWMSNMTYVTGDGIVSVKLIDKPTKGAKGTKGWHPKIVMKALKSVKLKPVELVELSARLRKLSKLSISAQETGQIAMYELLAREMACIIKAQEAAAIGYPMVIQRQTIVDFVSKTRDKRLKFDKLENFPRVIPKRVRDKINEVRAKGVFDEFWVAYIDYTEEKPLQTVKDKILEKDPILFGTFSVNVRDLHYVTDWVDRYCDLTLTKLVGEIQLEDPEFELDRVPDPTPEYLDEVVRKVEKSLADLSATNSSNYLAKMLEQEREARKSTEKKAKGLLKQLKDAGIKVLKVGSK